MRKYNYFSIFMRSLLLQSVWNFERMQNVGFMFSILPALKKIYADKAERLEALKSHSAFFNTHPYMANIIVGIVAGQEEKKAGGEINSEEILSLKTSISGPLAAIGDTFFWATWRPFCALLLVTAALIYGDFLTPAAALFAVACFLAVYNSLHFTVRYAGLKRACEAGTNVIKNITDMNTQKMTDVIRTAGIIVIWAAVILYFLLNLRDYTSKASFAALFILSTMLTNRSVSSTKIFCWAAAASFALKLAFTIGVR